MLKHKTKFLLIRWLTLFIFVISIAILTSCSKSKSKTPLDVWVRHGYYPEDDIGRISTIVLNPSDTTVVYAAARDALIIQLAYRKEMVHNVYKTMPSKYQVAVPLHMAMSGFGQPRIQYLEDIAIDPVDTKTLYAAFAGIFKSQDEGESWTQVYKMPTVLSIIVDPRDPAMIYAGHEMEGVLKSTDGGKTWEQALRAHFVNELLIDRTGNVLAASGGGLFRTSDQGKNWDKLSDRFLLSLVVHPTEDSVLYGTSATNSAGTELVLESNDRGHTWTVLYRVSHKGPEKFILAPKVPLVIDPKNASTMYLGTIGDSVLKTIDAGRTWSAMSNGLPSVAIISLAIDHENPSIVFAGTEDGEVFRIVQTK